MDDARLVAERAARWAVAAAFAALLAGAVGTAGASSPVALDRGPEAYVSELTRRAESELKSLGCIAGLHAAACQHRLQVLLDSSVSFPHMAEATLLNLPHPPDLGPFTERYREMLLRVWKRHLRGEPTVTLRVSSAAGEQVTVEVRRGAERWVAELVLVPRDGGGYAIADVTVDGRSLVRTWRPHFARVLRTDGWQALLDRLERIR